MTTKTSDENAWMEIYGSVDLPADEQVDLHYWYVECPGEYRVFFEDLNEADDWVWRQRDTGKPPDQFGHDRLLDEHGVYGFYVDLRE